MFWCSITIWSSIHCSYLSFFNVITTAEVLVLKARSTFSFKSEQNAKTQLWQMTYYWLNVFSVECVLSTHNVYSLITAHQIVMSPEIWCLLLRECSEIEELMEKTMRVFRGKQKIFCIFQFFWLIGCINKDFAYLIFHLLWKNLGQI